MATPSTRGDAAELALAGALVWRRGPRGLEVALAQRGGRWGLPRAGVGSGESRAAAAARLAGDWTGAGAEARGFAGTARSEAEGRKLSTWYFHFEAGPLQSLARPWVRWCSLGEARARLQDPEEQALLEGVRPPLLDRGPGSPAAADAAARPWTMALGVSLLGLLLLETPAAAGRAWAPLASTMLGGALGAALTGSWGCARWRDRVPPPATRALLAAAAAALCVGALAGWEPGGSQVARTAPLAGALATWWISARAGAPPRG